MADAIIIGTGVVFNTPGIIRANDKYANVPNDIEDKAIGIQDDINEVIKGASEL